MSLAEDLLADLADLEAELAVAPEFSGRSELANLLNTDRVRG
jgi:hypothetical protein